jgi:hypothetical protein
MKLQYLGDAKDSFKWDYHDFLVARLGYLQLTIVWMMTPDDGSSHGRTAPERFPARAAILRLCQDLRRTRNPALLLNLPAATGAKYAVGLCDPGIRPGGYGNVLAANADRGSGQVLLLDPDNGFEPERSATDRHVRYADLDRLLQALPADAVLSVFQHHRRKKFPEDYARIRERLLSGFSTAIYWHSLMFVSVSASRETLRRVQEINCEYAEQRPVVVIP